MRVIAGQFRRRTLVAPDGLATRPTSDRLRETLFNVLAPRLARAHFLDLYAGSGANGVEALSRGAALAVFVERDARALASIHANLAALKVQCGYRVEARAVSSWLRAASEKNAAGAESWATKSQTFDVIFLDPPYEQAEEYAATLGLLGGAASVLLGSEAIVVAEHRRARRGAAVTQESPADRYGSLRRMRLLEQGDAALSFYTVQEQAVGP